MLCKIQSMSISVDIMWSDSILLEQYSIFQLQEWQILGVDGTDQRSLRKHQKWASVVTYGTQHHD